MAHLCGNVGKRFAPCLLVLKSTGLFVRNPLDSLKCIRVRRQAGYPFFFECKAGDKRILSAFLPQRAMALSREWR